MSAPAGVHTRATPERVVLAVLIVLCGVLLTAGIANKARCTGPRFDAQGVSAPNLSTRQYRDVCYSDIQHLWAARGLDRHPPPYLHGHWNRSGQLTGGSVEYPVLTGVLIWLAALGSSNDAQFLLLSGVLLAPFGLFTAYALGRLTRWRALWWALAPPLVLYGCHNWDLAAVGLATAGFLLLLRGRGGLERRAVLAAVAFGLGFATKIYPGLFVVPLLMLVARHARPAAVWRVAAAAVGPAVLVNLPFAVLGFRGWWASWTFQAARKVDVTTDSVWFWGLRPWSDPGNHAFQSLIGVVSPVAVVAGCVLALWLGEHQWQRDGEYPFVRVCAAMLCAFLLLNKVDSPQYVLWLVPFFVLLRVQAGWIVGYFLADAALGIGAFRWFAHVNSGIYDGFAAQAVMIGVWGRAALLAGLFVAFLRAAPGWYADRLPRGRSLAHADGERRDDQREDTE